MHQTAQPFVENKLQWLKYYDEGRWSDSTQFQFGFENIWYL